MYEEQDNRKLTRSPLVWGVVLSILLHITALVCQIPRAQKSFLESRKQALKPIEVVQVPPEYLLEEERAETAKRQTEEKKKKAKAEKQIVESEKADNNEIDPDAQYLSDKNQKAKQEMRAKVVDDFRGKKGKGLKGKSQEADQLPPPTGEELAGKAAESPEINIGEAITNNQHKKNFGIKRDWRNLTLKDLSVNGDGGLTAATDDYLEDIAYGERTILSTREFKFYGYYHRIKQLLRQHWKPNVQRQIDKMIRKGRAIRKSERITKLLVLLNEEGKVFKVSRLSGSGINEIDAAAVEAFQAASPFPNPPNGMLDPDGFVRIRWDFILKTEAAPKIQFRHTGQRRSPSYR